MQAQSSTRWLPGCSKNESTVHARPCRLNDRAGRSDGSLTLRIAPSAKCPAVLSARMPWNIHRNQQMVARTIDCHVASGNRSTGHGLKARSSHKKVFVLSLLRSCHRRPHCVRDGIGSLERQGCERGFVAYTSQLRPKRPAIAMAFVDASAR